MWHLTQGSSTSEFNVALTNVFVSFFVPSIILLFPLIALFMQVCGARSPRLDPPHNRNAWTTITLSLIFVVTRSPFEIYELVKLFDRSVKQVMPSLGTRSLGDWSFTTDMTITCLVLLAPALHPIVYYAFNPEYRQGFKNIWKKGNNQTPADVSTYLFMNL